MIKHWLFTLLTTLALTLQSAYITTDDLLFSENFSSAETLKHWVASGRRPEFIENGAPEGQGGAVRFRLEEDGTSTISFQLDPAKVNGLVSFEGYIRGRDLSGKATYFGPKFMLACDDGKKKDFPEPEKGFGSFGWKKVKRFYSIPSGCRTIRFVIGIQAGRGELEVAGIRILRAREVSAEEAAHSGGIRAETGDMPRGPVVPGTKTEFRGVMSGDDLSPSAFAELRKWNVNLMRYQMRPSRELQEKLTTPEAFLAWIDSEIEKIDTIVLPQAKANGIKLVLDLHYGGQKVTRLLSNQLTRSTSNLKVLEESWRRLATKYRGNDAIYGYDLLNEPKPNDPQDNPWPEMAQRLIEVIREIDPDTPIIVEWFLTPPFAVKGENIIYSFHFYSPHGYTHHSIGGNRMNGWSYPGNIDGLWWDKEQLRDQLRMYLEFQRKHNARIFIGEFSVAAWAPGGAQWLRDTIELFDEYGWDWTYHAFREWPGWSVEHRGPSRAELKPAEDTDRKQVLLKYLQRNKK